MDRQEPRWLPLLRLLPNVVTMLGLCAGLTSIRYVIEGRFELAVGLILVAAVIDGLDGMLARRLKAASEFGAEIDSLSDFLNFGVAPALLVFHFALAEARGLGWVFLLVYVSCCCLRLARFNIAKDQPVEADDQAKPHFVGVPAPAGALLVLLPVFLSFQGVADAASAPIAVALYMGLVGLAMVSTIRTISPKGIYIPREKIIYVMIATPVIAGALVTRPWLVLIAVDVAYACLLVRSCALALRAWRS